MTKKISLCTTTASLEEVYKVNAPAFNSIHLNVFWKAIAGVRISPGRKDSREALVALVALAGGRTLELAPSLAARCTSIILFSMARLRYLALAPPSGSPLEAGHPAGAVVLGALQNRAAEVVGEFEAHNVGMLLWALATLECGPPATLLALLSARLLEVAPELSSQGLGDSAFALSKLKVAASSDLVEALEARALAFPSDFKPQQISKVLIGARGRTPGEEMGEARDGRQQQRVSRDSSEARRAFKISQEIAACQTSASLEQVYNRHAPAFNQIHLNVFWKTLSKVEKHLGSVEARASRESGLRHESSSSPSEVPAVTAKDSSEDTSPGRHESSAASAQPPPQPAAPPPSRVRHDSSAALWGVVSLAGGRTLELAPHLSARAASNILHSMARLKYLARAPPPQSAPLPAAGARQEAPAIEETSRPAAGVGLGSPGAGREGSPEEEAMLPGGTRAAEHLVAALRPEAMLPGAPGAHPGAPAGHQAVVVVGALLQRVPEVAENLEAQNISMILWALATLESTPPANVLAALEAQLLALSPELTPQGIANSAWAFAKLKVTLSPALAEALETRFLFIASEFQAQDIAILLWAFATMRITPSPLFFQGLQRRAEPMCGKFGPHDVAMVVWALGKMHVQVEGGLMAALEKRATQVAIRMDASQMTMVVVGLGEMGERVSSILLEAVMSRVLAVAPQLAPREVAGVMQHLVTIGAREAPPSGGAEVFP
ncbi:hypothetical protein T484DRAFT_1826533 [Baffinella frigidus]|nr:hypothetical protein T484DRAFT_1826533 [Cryptophyta sp. CCMP2293]